MGVIRSAAFNIAFYVGTAFLMIVQSPYYFLASRRNAYGVVVQGWGRFVNRQMRIWAGATFTIEGLENLPDGPASSPPSISLPGIRSCFCHGSRIRCSCSSAN